MRKFLIISVLLLQVLDCVNADEVDRKDQGRQSDGVYLKQSANEIEVFVGGDPFTTYHFAGYNKPIFFPLRAASGTVVTRGYPMVPGIPGEAQDHPHHK